MDRILSIIVTVYNCEKFLPKFFANIEKINDKIEVIFINDGSTDNSLEIIEQNIKNKNNIYVYTKKNGGASSARNLGIKKAKGKYLFFADCDDYFTEDAFDIILKSLDNLADIYIYDFKKIENNESYESWINLPDAGYFEIEKEAIIEDYLNGRLNSLIGPALWNKVFKKSLITKNKLALFENKKLSEDWLFNIECMMNSKSIYVVNEAIYNYVIHNNSITRRYKTWLIKDLENTYKILPQICKKYGYKNYDKYLMKMIIPSTVNIIKNESNTNFWEGLISLKKFFSSKNFKKYLKALDKKSLIKKELLYYFLIVTKAYIMIYVMYFLEKKIIKIFKGE